MFKCNNNYVLKIKINLQFLGAVDGKHIVVQAPINAGSSFYHYKGTHSVVLLAV